MEHKKESEQCARLHTVGCEQIGEHAADVINTRLKVAMDAQHAREKLHGTTLAEHCRQGDYRAGVTH
jgi:hypothetical protein